MPQALRALLAPEFLHGEGWEAIWWKGKLEVHGKHTDFTVMYVC